MEVYEEYVHYGRYVRYSGVCVVWFNVTSTKGISTIRV